MKTYSFWSGGTIYITRYKSLKNAVAVGIENYNHYWETCKYLEIEQTVGSDYFVPEIIEENTTEYAKWLLANDKDTMVLESETEEFLTNKS